MDLKLVLVCSIIAFSASAPVDQQVETLGLSAEAAYQQPNPEEAGYFEGDMVLDENELAMLKSGIKAAKYRWPANTVSYRISESFNEDQVEVINAAIKEITSKTCIKFKEISEEDDVKGYILVNNKKSGCFSKVGYRGRKQILNLAEGCFRNGIGTIAHEFVHAIGYHHEQSRTDRDDYVTIEFQNIKPGKEGNFKKYDATYVDPFGVSYDYGSLMHYSNTAFTKNGLDTILPKQEGVTIGQRTGLSEKDVQKLNNMYKC